MFLDGVGIGPDDEDRNPFLRASLPVLRGLLDGRLPTLDDPRTEGRAARAFPVDANLGLEGIPQSGTGQTSLLTGRNTGIIFGRHFGPWTPVMLRPLLARENLLTRVLELGGSSAFANAYPERWRESRRARFPAAPPLAAEAAGLLTRHADALARGDAVASGILNEGWREHLGHRHVPRISAEEAGANLARIATSHDLTLYAHYGTDLAGHRGGMQEAVAALERVDAFLGGVLDGLSAGSLLVVASDHGNVEDVTAGHTRNPSLGLVGAPGGAGPPGLPPEGSSPGSIHEVAPAILGWLRSEGTGSPPAGGQVEG